LQNIHATHPCIHEPLYTHLRSLYGIFLLVICSFIFSKDFHVTNLIEIHIACLF